MYQIIKTTKNNQSLISIAIKRVENKELALVELKKAWLQENKDDILQDYHEIIEEDNKLKAIKYTQNFINNYFVKEPNLLASVKNLAFAINIDDSILEIKELVDIKTKSFGNYNNQARYLIQEIA
jgi:nucleoside diphosphate kinase